MIAGFTVASVELVLLNALMALSAFAVLSGGTFSFAFTAFVGFGAYLGAIVDTRTSIPLAGQLALAIVGSAIIALLIFGLVSRLTGIYLGILTVSIVAVFGVFLNNLDVTGGPAGIPGISLSVHWPILISTVAIVCAGFAFIDRTAFGSWVRLVRADPLVATALGVNVRVVRGTLFMLSGVIAAVTGVLQAHYLGFVSPDTYSFSALISVLSMAVIGGLSHWSGPLIGALLITMLPQWLQSINNFTDAATGAILLIVIVVMPSGLVGGAAQLLRFGLTRLRPSPVGPNLTEGPDSSDGNALSRSEVGNDNATL